MRQTFIETITSKIDGILETAEQERKELSQKLAEAKEELSEARNRMEAATASADAAAYRAAKQDEAVAATAVEMYTQRLSQLSGDYLVSDEENADTVAAIQKEQKKIADEATQKILTYLKKIEQIGKTYFDNQDALNDLIWRWNQEVYKTAMYPSSLHYKDSELRHCISALVTLYFYRVQTGRKQYHGIGSIWE